MKKFLLLTLGLVISLAAMGCSSHDHDEPISFNALPAPAQSFIKTYFKGLTTTRVEKDGHNGTVSYDVMLSDGTDIDFDSRGEWTDVDAPAGKTVPSGIVMAPIAKFVADTYPNMGINEISRDANGYDVELTNGVDLEFTVDGAFIRIDH